MDMSNCGHGRLWSGRVLARRAWQRAEADCADAAGIVRDLHDLAPNPRNRIRFARRIGRRRGVVRAWPTAEGLSVLFRTTHAVTVRRDGTDCYAEQRIAWTMILAVAGRGRIAFVPRQVHVNLHAIQRHVERSDCPMTGLLAHMDKAMGAALGRLERAEPLRDRDDEFLPDPAGVWAGGLDRVAPDPDWGPAFRADGAPLPVFSVHTFLGEAQMRATVWLGWSRAIQGPLPSPASPRACSAA